MWLECRNFAGMAGWSPPVRSPVRRPPHTLSQTQTHHAQAPRKTSQHQSIHSHVSPHVPCARCIYPPVLACFGCFPLFSRAREVRVGENQKEKNNSTLNHSHAVVAPHRDSSTHHTPTAVHKQRNLMRRSIITFEERPNTRERDRTPLQLNSRI